MRELELRECDLPKVTQPEFKPVGSKVHLLSLVQETSFGIIILSLKMKIYTEVTVSFIPL